MSEQNTLHFQNYFRLNVLVTTCGCGILRQHFRQRYQLLMNKEWVDGSGESKGFLLKQMNGTLKHFPKIQKSMLETGDLGKWDITVLSSLLTKINYGANVTVEVNEKLREQNKCILQLTEIRNKLAHLPDKVLSENEFIGAWVEAEKVLVFLGVPWQDVENIRKGSGLVGLELKDWMLLKENSILAASLCTEGIETLKCNSHFETGIHCFTKALALHGLSEHVRGMLLSNRSLAYMRWISTRESPSDDEIFDFSQLALEDARAAIHLQPSWWSGYVRAARVYQFRKEWQAATILMTRAVELNQALQGTVGRTDEYHCVTQCSFLDQEGSLKCEDTVKVTSPEVSKARIEEIEEEEQTNPRDKAEVLNKAWGEVHQSTKKPEDSDTGSAGNVSTARFCLEGNVEPLDFKIVPVVSEATNDNNAETTYKLGLMHLNGLGIPKDINVAIELFEKAALFPKKQKSQRNIGVAEAKFLLGKCYEEGIGKAQDITQAVDWYIRASKEGLNEATNKLALLYSDGILVTGNYDKAISYWSIAAERGDASAMNSLAFAYLKRENIVKADSWFCRFLNTGKANDSDIKKFQKEIAAYRRGKSHRETLSCLKDPEIKVEQKQVYNSLEKGPTIQIIPKETTFFGKCFDFENQIRQKAESQSNLYTQKLLSSMEAYVNGMDLLGSFITRENQMTKAEKRATRTTLLEMFSTCFRHITQMTVELPPKFQRKLEKITEEVIYATAQYKSDQDKNARIIRNKLLKTSIDQYVGFLRLSADKYPTEDYFCEMLSSTFLLVDRNEEGLKITKAAIKSFPLNQDLNFLQAEHFRCGIEGQKLNKSKTCLRRAASAYQHFLKLAPLDHPKYPAAYYGLAIILFWLGEISEGEGYFKRGVEKETDLLPCFAFGNSACKLTCETLYSERVSSNCVDSSSEITTLTHCSNKVDDTSDYFTQETENKSDEEESDARSEYPKDSTDTGDYSEETDSISSESYLDHISTIESKNEHSNRNPETNKDEERPSNKPESFSWRSTGYLIIASTLLVSMWLSRTRN